ncbi:MAG: GGDEF domain-containing protein [Ilumatobacter sp.]|nr:GGDEF domain-containing protein [Ilumatobacter sp.]
MAINFRRSRKHDEDLIVDRVTGAFNRRQLDLDIANGVDPSGLSTATLIVEVDDCDKYGKPDSAQVNQILERVAWVVMATVRTSDIVYRQASSSFCILLPATADDDASIVAERIRANIESTPLLCESNVTVSVGVAIGPSKLLGETVERADAALHSISGSGGNRVAYS